MMFAFKSVTSFQTSIVSRIHRGRIHLPVRNSPTWHFPGSTATVLSATRPFSGTKSISKDQKPKRFNLNPTDMGMKARIVSKSAPKAISSTTSAVAVSKSAADNNLATSAASPSPVYRRGVDVWIQIDKFGTLGASVSVVPVSVVGEEASDAALDAAFTTSQRPTGLILQKEITTFRARRGGQDVLIGDRLRGWVARVYQGNDEGDAGHGDHEDLALSADHTDLRMDIALRPLGKDRIEENAELILTMLRQAEDGVLPVGDRSSPEDIAQCFRQTLGKTDFKNAVGALYRQGLVEPSDVEIRLLSDRERDELLNARKHQITAKYLATRNAETGSKHQNNKNPRLFIGNVPRNVSAKELHEFLTFHLSDASEASGKTDAKQEILSLRGRSEKYRPHSTTVADQGNAKLVFSEGFAFVDLATGDIRDRLVAKLQGFKWKGKKLRLDAEDNSDRNAAAKTDKLASAEAFEKPRDSSVVKAKVEEKRVPRETPTEEKEEKEEEEEVLQIVKPRSKEAKVSREMVDIDDFFAISDSFSSSTPSTTPSSYSSSSSSSSSSSTTYAESRRYNNPERSSSSFASSNSYSSHSSSNSHNGRARTSSRGQSGPGRDAITLFVGNLSFETSEEDLKQFVTRKLASNSLLSVTDARIVTDGFSGRKRGFGYVDVRVAGSADGNNNDNKERVTESCVSRLHEQKLDGRALRVTPAEQHRRTRD